VNLSIIGYRETVDRLPWNGIGVWLQETSHWAHKSIYFDINCILMPLLIAVGLTILRITLNKILFNVR